MEQTQLRQKMPLIGYGWLWFDDQLALHVPVPEAAVDAALERVGSRSTGNKFHRRRLIFFQLDALLLRREYQAGIPFCFWLRLDTHQS